MAISGWGVFLIIFFLVLIGGGGGYVLYAHYRAKKLGLPPPNLNPFQSRRGDSGFRAPAPGSGGIGGWFADQWQSLRNARTAGGAYEGAGSGGAQGYHQSTRGFGALEPDEAWNARVDDEAGGYYEEQELGLQDPSRGPYGGGGYGRGGAASVGSARGRSRSRDGRPNPFGDHAEPSDMSLRSVSPRPETDAIAKPPRPPHMRGPSNLSAENSPTERRSMFKEDV